MIQTFSQKIGILILGLILTCDSSIYAMEPAMKHFWLKDKHNIQLITSEQIDMNQVSLLDSKGKKIPFQILRQTVTKVDLQLKDDLTVSPWYKVLYKGSELISTPHFEYLNKYFQYTGPLGISKKGNQYTFHMWSPSAHRVELVVYENYSETVLKRIDMIPGERGHFAINLPESFKGKSYLYHVHYGALVSKALDPYAKVMEAFNPKNINTTGRGVIEYLPEPKPRLALDNMASQTDFVGYEVHIRDFSVTQNGGGTYDDFVDKLTHIQDLGVTHIQFMPLQNFYTVVEEDRSWQGSDAPKNDINYNWGYDPQNYFTPEGHFSKDASDPLLRVREVKKMVSEVHKKNIGAILDVVYNHLYAEDTLEKAAPGSYMRRNENGHISFKSGAGASLESRNLMTRRLIIDSLLWWKNYYGFDGFRFDLMGFTDIDSMREVRRALGTDTVLYGEAWEFTDLPVDQATTKSRIPDELNISAFNDTSRDSYTGHMEGKGFVQGISYELPKVRAGIVAGYQKFPTRGGVVSQDQYHLFAKSPVQALNYLTIHDGFTLWDKINLSWKGTVEARQRLFRQAFAMLMTSQGRVVLHGGVEIGRTKPLSPNDPNPNRAHTSGAVDPENGVSYFHENSYRSPDVTNAVDWSRKSLFQKEFTYLKKLIELRRKVPALRFEKGENLSKGLTFIGGGKIHWPPSDSAGFKSFKEPGLDHLEIEFINGPSSVFGTTWYLAGEVHPKGVGGDGKNPKNNPFAVRFDQSGRGKVTLNKSDLSKLDLTTWSDPIGLQFKLVSPAGSWTTVPGAYSTMGNNTIHPLSISKNKKVVLDLSQLNHEAGKQNGNTEAFIAYRLDNTLETSSIESPLPYKELIVVHNGEQKTKTLVLNELNSKDWKLILDSENINFNGLTQSENKLAEGRLEVAAGASAILVKTQ
jgi:pullulanase